MLPPHLLGATRLLFFVLLFYSLPPLIAARKHLDYCSPPGPHVPFVSANTIHTSPSIQQKLAELTNFLEEISSEAEEPLVFDSDGETVGGINLAVSITTPTETIYNFNHGLRTTSEGPNPWTEHTIFRVASVSKALTVWELVKLGVGWDEKVTRYLPELAEGRYKKEWAEVTVGALAGYVGGAIRDFEHDISLRPEYIDPTLETLWKRDGSKNADRKNSYFIPEDSVHDIDGFVESVWAAYFPDFQPSEAWKMGFPPLEEIEQKRCFYNCTRKDLLLRLADHPLVYPAYTNPAYSNVGFSILGLVLERKSGLAFESLMQRDMYGPLGMNDTFHSLPWDAHEKQEGWGAHPFWGANDTWWETKEIWGDWGVPAGGVYTSAHDLSIFIRTILAAFPFATDPQSYPNKYSLLPAEKVREWLNPSGFTGGKTLLGRPWEIKRKQFGDCHGGRPLTLFSKAGGGTGYNAGITIIPELGIGITILVAGDGGNFKQDKAQYSYHWRAISRVLFEQKGLLKSIEQAAYQQAEREYLGEYLFNSFVLDGDDGTGNPLAYLKINDGPIFSGIELIRDKGPGLRIKRWISNGTDFLETLLDINMQMRTQGVEGAIPVARIYPVGNVRARGPDRWAEDWRVWFEWEWENLPNGNTGQPHTPKSKPPGREKEKIQTLKHSPSADMPRQVYPDILPGDSEPVEEESLEEDALEEEIFDEEFFEDKHGRKKAWPKPTKSSVSVSSSEDDEDPHTNNPKRPWYGAKKYGRKNRGGKKNKLKELVFPSSNEDSTEEKMEEYMLGKENKDKFMSYVPALAEGKHRGDMRGLSGDRPIWWRDKFDTNKELRKYRERKESMADEDEEENEELEMDEIEDQKGVEDRVSNGRKDKVINYTFKKAEAHGAGVHTGKDADDAEEEEEDDEEEEEEEDDLDGIWFRRRGLNDFTSGEHEKYDDGMYSQDDNDENFFIPNHPPHAPAIPLVFGMQDEPEEYHSSDQDEPEEYSFSKQATDDGTPLDNPQADHTMKKTSAVHEAIAAKWKHWIQTEEARKKDEGKRKIIQWPCADYNGIELQSWAGWSMGLVRILREGQDRRVVGMEIPALKVRFGKVGATSLGSVAKRKMFKKEDGKVGMPVKEEQKSQRPVYMPPRGSSWRTWPGKLGSKGKNGDADEL